MLDAIWRDRPLDVLADNAAGNFLAQSHRLPVRAVDAVLGIVLHRSACCTPGAGRRWIAGGRAGSVLPVLTLSALTGAAFTVPSAMAKAAGADPVAFRLRHLEDQRARDVAAAAAARFGWTPGQAPPPGRGYGFGFARCKNLAAYCAVANEVRWSARPGGRGWCARRRRWTPARWSIPTAAQPGRGRDPAIGKLDLAREHGLQPACRDQHRLVHLSHPALRGGAGQRRGSRPGSSGPAVPGRGRDGPGAGRGLHRQRGCERDGLPPARPAAVAGAGEGCHRRLASHHPGRDGIKAHAA